MIIVFYTIVKWSLLQTIGLSDQQDVQQWAGLSLALLVEEWRPLVLPPFPRAAHHRRPIDDLHFQDFHPKTIMKVVAFESNFSNKVQIYLLLETIQFFLWLTRSAAPPGNIFLTTAPLFLLPLIPKPNPFPSLVSTIPWICAHSHWSYSFRIERMIIIRTWFILFYYSSILRRLRIIMRDFLPPWLMA